MDLNSVDSVQSGASSINQDDLFKILLTQLQYQDPLEPIDNQDFIAQLAQFTNLEQTRSINEKLDDVLLTQNSHQSISLLERTVQVDLEGTTEVGRVIAVSFDDGSPRFTLITDDDRIITDVRIAQIQTVN